jgi:hypothetical protein
VSDKPTFRIPISNGIFEHCKRIGVAVWYFMWCIDATTKEITDDKGRRIGLVYGGAPIHDEDVASLLAGVHVNSVRRWRIHLTREGYIETTRTPNGYSIRVINSKKKWVSDPPKMVTPKPKPAKSDPPKMVSDKKCDSPKTGVDSPKTGVDSPKTGVDSQEVVNAIRLDKDSTKTNQSIHQQKLDGLMDLFFEKTGGHVKKFTLSEIEKDIEKHGYPVVETAFSQMIAETNWGDLRKPNRFILSDKGYRSYLPSAARTEARKAETARTGEVPPSVLAAMAKADEDNRRWAAEEQEINDAI